MIGIYLIKNKTNGKSYVGKSIDIGRRWSRHRAVAFNKSEHGYNYPLYRAIRKYGLENFEFSVLEECPKNMLNFNEEKWVSVLDTFNNGYNQTKGGERDHSKQVKINTEILNEIVSLLKFSSMTMTEIAKKFNIGIDTVSEINNGKTRIIVGELYPLRKTRRDKTYCMYCGKPLKTLCSNRCKECACKMRRKVDRPDNDTLLKLLKTNSFVKVGEMYGVSDNAIRKWLGLK